jgi:predicted dehydrogenase
LVRVGVVGAGYLGKFHIQKIIDIPNCTLTAISDVSDNVLELYKSYNVLLTKNYRDFLGKVDAVSIVVPTTFHYEIAEFFIKNGVHVFLEKPATTTSIECEKLLNMKPDNLVVQVGHIERFNPDYINLKKNIKSPKLLNFVRKSPFTNRGVDVDVVFDLMIHDIDLALSFFSENSVIKNLCVTGGKIVTEKNDYMIAKFNINDVLVNIECSRVSSSKERKITILENDSIKSKRVLSSLKFVLPGSIITHSFVSSHNT